MNPLSKFVRNASKTSRQSQRRPASRRLRMESLEQRTMFSASPINVVLPPPVLSHTYTVTTVADSGVGSLRWAIGQVNQDTTSPLPDTINFKINSPLGVPVPFPTISPLSALPVITRAVIIDGTTQRGGRVELNGTREYRTSSGLELLGGNSTVRGLAIDGFGGDGLILAGKGGDTVQDDYLGTYASGTQAPTYIPSGGTQSFFIQQDGLFIDNVGNNLIGGTTATQRNVISGNADYGIQITGSAATGNSVEGNYIGTDYTGLVGISNAVAGVYLDSTTSNNTIGGPTAGARNVISYNVYGVSAGGKGDVIQGNFIGTDATGLHSLGNIWGVGAGGGVTVTGNVISGNTADGVGVSSGATVIGNFIGLDATGDTVLQNGYSGIDITGSNNIIGGTTAASRNVISGNHNANILLNAGSSHNQVLGNYIGTNASDWIVLANDIDIMIQDGSSYNTIGGTTAAAANVIANAGVGVEITGSPSAGGEPTHNTVEGNYIGTNAAGTKMGNGDGVEIATAATSAAPDHNLIGGLAAGARNTIAFNGTGIDVLGGSGEAILGNSIYSNTVHEILLESAAANDGQVAPTLNSVNRNTNSVQVSGKLQSTPKTKFTIQIFSSPGLDAEGNPEGETLLGTITVTTDANGNANFNTTLNVQIPKNQFITATATSLDANGNPVDTSEFSKAIMSN